MGNELSSGSGDILGAISESLSDFSLSEATSNAATFAELGADGEAVAVAGLAAHGYTPLESQLYIKTAAGVRIADFWVSDAQSNKFLVEVKTNSSVRSLTQARKDYLIQEFGGTIKSFDRRHVEYNQKIFAPTLVLNVKLGRP
jgi:hypothetical protein